MRATILALMAFALLLATPAALADEATLDPVVKDVLLLLESGVDEGVIQTWLEKRGSRPASVGVDELIALKNANASEALVKRLVLLTMPGESVPAAPAARPEAPPVRKPDFTVPKRSDTAPVQDTGELTTEDRVRKQVNPLERAQQPGATGAEGARERLVALLVSDSIQRIQFEGTSIEAVAGRVDTAVARILEDGKNLGDSPDEIADLAEQIILGINDHKPNLEERTLGPNAHNLVVNSIGDAKVFGNLVNLLGGVFRRAANDAEDRFSARATTAKILDQFVVDPSAMDFPILFQYEDNLKQLAMESTNELQSLLVAK